MKRIVSISIGSSERDKKVETDILGEHFIIERIGTDGDINKAIQKIKELDGKVDAFGMGGIDLYLTGADKSFMIREAVHIKNAAGTTPILDGTFLKNTLEGRVIKYLNDTRTVDFKGRKVLMTCAVDRYRMALELERCGCDLVFGDLMFVLGIPIPMRSLETFRKVVDMLLPVVSLLPFKMLYPVGKSQGTESRQSAMYRKYYEEADIIAGDFHYIKKHMPENMAGKIVITNTVTEKDIEMMKKRGVELLVTTTPEFDGRSFGTNVIEAILVSISGKKPDELCEQDFFDLIDRAGLKPRIQYLRALPKTAGM